MKCTGNSLSRRSFLTVGALGSIGLTLGDFFRLQQAQAYLKNYDFIPAKAQSVIHIFMPRAMAHKQ